MFYRCKISVSLLLMSTVFTFLLFGKVHAEEANSTKEIECEISDYSGGDFQGLYDSAAKAGKEFCRDLIKARLDQNTIDETLVGKNLATFGSEAERTFFDRKLNSALSNTSAPAQFERMKLTFRDFSFRSDLMPEFWVMPQSFVNTAYFQPIIGDSLERMKIKADCATSAMLDITADKTCKEVFSDFALAFNAYRSPYNKIFEAKKNIALIEELGDDWDKFLRVSKDQTFIEVAATTFIQQDHFKRDYIVGPPPFQIIALHPRLIYSYMDDAPSGDEQEIGLAIEWVGINFWDWKVPFGASLTSTYVDRADTDNVGIGVMLHFWNTYSVGWADHDGDDSVYLSLDLLKLFNDGKKQFDRYSEHF